MATEELKVKELKVSGGTPHKSLAGSILHSFDSGYDAVDVISIGPLACSQCVKAHAHARNLSLPKGKDVVSRPRWSSIETTEKTVSGLIHRFEMVQS